MSLVPSLLQAIVHLDGEALVMHAGDKPYVVSPTGQVDLATRGLALDAINGIVNHLLPVELQNALDEFGAVQHELAGRAEFPGEHFTVVAARGGDDIWVEIRRRRVPDEDQVPDEFFPAPDEVAKAQPYPVYATAGSPDLRPVSAPMDDDSLEIGETLALAPTPPPPPIEPIVEPSPVVERRHVEVFQPPPAVVQAPIAAPEPVAEPEPVFLAESEPDAELPEPQPQPMLVEPQPAPAFAETEPEKFEPLFVATETQPLVLPEPEPVRPVEPEPVLVVESEPEPVLDASSAPLPKPEPEPVLMVEPEPEPEPVELVSEFEFEPESELELESISGREPEAVYEFEPELVSEFESEPSSQFESEPTSQFEAEPASQFESEPVSESAVVERAPEPVAPVAEAAPLAVENLPDIRAFVEQSPVDEPVPVMAEETVAQARAPEPVADVRAPEPVADVQIPEPVADGRLPEPGAEIPEPEPAAAVEAMPEPPVVAAPPATPTRVPEPVFAPQPIPAAAQFAPQPAVVLPLARNPIRAEQPLLPIGIGDPTMSGLDRLLRLAAARGASTLYLSSQSRPSVRVDSDLQTLEGEPVLTSRDVESLLLTLMPERNHEALRTGATTEWIVDIEDVGRVRCMSFRDHLGPGGVFRLMPTRSVSADQLALPRVVQSLAGEQEGLVLVAGPRSSGKRTLMSALIDLINRTRRDHVITIEREINIAHERGTSFISQREVRGNDDDMLVAARAALREDPDVLMIEELRTAALMNVAFEAAHSGHLVIGGFSAHTATAAVDRIIDLYDPEQRRHVQLALAESLRGVVSQVLLRKHGGGRVAAREVLLNTPAVSSVIAEGKTSQLPMAIEGGRRYGMIPLNDALVGLVQQGLVDGRDAYRYSSDRPGLLALLARQGVDTSFVEKLA